MLEKIQETAAFLKEKMHTNPETAIILGTGLGSLVHEITDKYEISYKDIPNFPVSTVEGHSGKLIFGKLGDKDIMAMQGRFHFYEGYSMKEVTFPVRVMRELGIKTLFVSNAAGGTNPAFEIGDLMGSGMAGKKTWHNKQLLVRRTPTGKTKFNTVGNDERQARRTNVLNFM